MKPKGQPITIARVVDRKAIAVTRLALDRAQWRCESCEDDTELRVVEDRACVLVVLCMSCRLDAAWAPGVGRA
jgi:hypothetical protein